MCYAYIYDTLYISYYVESNERDRNPLLSLFIERQTMGTARVFNSEEECGNNRSVMPLDVPGCTRATMIVAESIYFLNMAHT